MWEPVLSRPWLMTAALLMAAVLPAAADPAIVDSRLNLRAGPGPAFNVIAVIPAGTKLDVQTCGDDWCRVTFGRRTGYASKAMLRTGVDAYAAATPQPQPQTAEPKVTITGPTVWQWRNDDWRNEHWRDLGWHNRMNQR